MGEVLVGHNQAEQGGIFTDLQFYRLGPLRAFSELFIAFEEENSHGAKKKPLGAQT